jgi:hypothetical protein
MESNDEIPFGWLPWARGQRLFCTLRTFHGKTGLDIRLFFHDPESGDWRPTQKGIWVPIQRAQEFHDLIVNAYARLKAFGGEKTPPSEYEPTPPPKPVNKEPTDQEHAIGQDVRHSDREEPDEDPEELMNRHLKSK